MRSRVNRDDFFSVTNHLLEMMIEKERKAAERMARQARRRLRVRRFKAAARLMARAMEESVADACHWRLTKITIAVWAAIGAYEIFYGVFAALR